MLSEVVSKNILKLKEEQEKDVDLSSIIGVLKSTAEEREKVKVSQDDSDWLKILKRNLKKLKLNEDGVLVRESNSISQVVLPKSMRSLIYEHLHIDMGHIGSEKVIDLAKKRVFWPRMNEDIENFVSGTCVCITQRNHIYITKHRHISTNGTCHN